MNTAQAEDGAEQEQRAPDDAEMRDAEATPETATARGSSSMDGAAAVSSSAPLEQPHREQETYASAHASDRPRARSQGKRTRTNPHGQRQRQVATKKLRREAAELVAWLSDDMAGE
jgi:hypothetical protein